MLETLITQNLYSLYVFMGTVLPLEYRLEIGDQFSFIRSETSGWPDFVFDIDLKNETERTIERIKAGIEKDNLPPFLVINKVIGRERVEKILESSGFRLSMEWSGMAVEINGKYELFEDKNLEIRQVVTDKELDQWFDIVNYELFPYRKFEENIFKILSQGDKIKLFLAFDNGIPAGTLMLFTSSGISGIYMVAVNEENRKKGIGTVLTKHALNVVYEDGYGICVLQSTDVAKKMYLNCGFREYSVFDIFWKVGKF